MGMSFVLLCQLNVSNSVYKVLHLIIRIVLGLIQACFMIHDEKLFVMRNKTAGDVHMPLL